MDEASLNVLLVDGDPTSAGSIRRAMAEVRPPFRVRHVGSVIESVSGSRGEPWDVALINLVTCEPAGLAGLALVEAQAPEVPVVGLAPAEYEDLALRALQQGAADYLIVEQIHPTLLGRSLRHAVERHRAEHRRRRAEEELRVSEARYRALFEQSRDAILITRPDGRIVDCNLASARLLGYDSGELLDMSLRELFRDAAEAERLMAELEAEGGFDEAEVRLRRKDRRVLWCLLAAAARADTDGRPMGHEAIIHDITARKVAEERLLHDAFHDSLTGLPNRALFSDRLGRTVARWRRHREPGFAVMFLDVDRFKLVNDSLGHSVGDLLLIQLAEALTGCVRGEDTVARMGGDEFAILLEGIDGEPDAVASAERIRACLEEPFPLPGRSTFASASIGIALPATADQTPEDLLRNADIAMYRAKATGPGRYRVFTPTMHRNVAELHALENDLRMALGRGEFILHYQPIMSTEDERIIGAEALVRWRHPVRGLLPPDAFISLAEETGLIAPIGRWVLGEACRQAAGWLRDYGEQACPLISVNLSGKQLLVDDFAVDVESVLRETGLPPHMLSLEITESLLLSGEGMVLDTLGRLRTLGVKLSIDDFGTGYSSLSYLHTLPIDQLKIDRSFISGLGTRSDQSELVGAILTLAQRLGMSTVAEGVETREQLAHLQRLGSRYVQGFLFSVPVDAARATLLVSANAA